MFPCCCDSAVENKFSMQRIEGVTPRIRAKNMIDAPTTCCGVYPPQEIVDNTDTPLFKGASSTVLRMMLAWSSVSVAEGLAAASWAEEDPPISEAYERVE
jgi:hypothetical protein